MPSSSGCGAWGYDAAPVLQRGSAGAVTDDSGKMRSVDEARASADFRGRHPIEQRGTQHPHRYSDPGVDEPAAERFMGGRQGAMQRADRDIEGDSDVRRAELGFGAALRDAVGDLGVQGTRSPGDDCPGGPRFLSASSL